MGAVEEAVPAAVRRGGPVFRWRRGTTRGGCIVIPCGCLVSLPFLFLGVAVAQLLVLRTSPPSSRWVLADARFLAISGEKGS